MNTVLTVLAGLLDLGFAAFHLLFWRLFGWPERLKASGRTNAAVTQTLNIMLTLVFVLYGAKLLHLGLQGLRADRELLGAGVLFGLVRSALQPVLFGLDSGLSRLFLAVALGTTAVHAGAML